MTSEPLANAEQIVAAGMDFIEPGLAKIAAMSMEDFDAAATRIKARQISVLSANWFLPPTVKVTGPDVDEAITRQFLDTAFGRAKTLGATAVVFGSPGSRSIPAGFSTAKARDQMISFCRLCADIIRENNFGIRIAVEHVNHTETNFINTFTEALEIARVVDRPEIGLAADFYHFEMENEPTDIILDAADLICAVQLADPTGRCFPKPGNEVPRLEQFFQHLIDIGYLGGVSIEAKTTGELGAECRGAVDHMMKVLQRCH